MFPVRATGSTLNEPITSVHSPPSFSRSIASRPITSRACCSIIVILFPERRRRNCCTLGKRIVTLLFNPGSANRANNEDHCAPCQRNLPTIFPSVGKEERKGKASPRFSLIYADSVRNFSSFFFLSRERGVGGKSGACNRDRGSKSLRVLTSTVARPRTPFIYDPRKLRNPCVYGRVTARLAIRLVSPFSSLQTELNPAQSFLLLANITNIVIDEASSFL